MVNSDGSGICRMAYLEAGSEKNKPELFLSSRGHWILLTKEGEITNNPHKATYQQWKHDY